MKLLSSKKIPALAILLFALLVSLTFKLILIGTGAPYTTIDDNTLYNAGFLVWFGEAPPQRMYLESWLTGITSVLTYVSHLVSHNQIAQLNLNIVADAFRDFQNDPSDYVRNYRVLMLSFDLLTAYYIYRLSCIFFARDSNFNWLTVLPSSLYLLTYNTLWCNLVARPDTMTAFFAVLGVYAYLRSAQGTNTKQLYLSAIFLGCATGFKLHAALFVVAIIADLIRVHGTKFLLNRVVCFGGIAVFLFCVTAGSPLFDPLLYVKLRALNIKDDASPWLHQGAQFLTMLRGSGWVSIPLMLGAIFLIVKNWRDTLDQNLKSLLLICTVFLLLFCCLRVLRGYWMLPVIGLFYVLASYALSNLKNKMITAIAVSTLCGLMAFQSYQQYEHFTKARYSELQNWVKANVKHNDTLYIVGFDTLFLPKSTTCLQNQKAGLERGLNSSLMEGESFTHRHVRLWEERSELVLIDLLNATSSTGYNYYSLNNTQLEYFRGIVNYEDIDYMLVMKGITDLETKGLLKKVRNDFIKITEANSPGGKSGTGGLTYEIYKRKTNAN